MLRITSRKLIGWPPVSSPALTYAWSGLAAEDLLRGDAARWNPEDLLLATTSACHKLWYLHLCAEAGISVDSYLDKAEGTRVEGDKGSFTEITLKPEMVIRAGDDIELVRQLHHQAHEACFIANSLNLAVLCEPKMSYAAS